MELLVVSGILVLITSILLFNNARFGGVVLLENLAYDVALSIRQAQVYGISVSRFGTKAFDVGYGIHFETGGQPSVYVLFADTTVNGLYDVGETVLSTTVEKGFFVSDLCTSIGLVNEVCGRISLDVLFKRPEPAAYIRANRETTLYERGRIQLSSPRGDIKNVIVEVSGQISVQ
ncbi:hypothetical protein A2673_02360 [Candidatus Kaiserbacteria bacterium RIFCSPHIGHO2_01_FULL_50_13]|uniref:General secretion pathway GspH domain-containing protein n=1 Tax=Candidatus Kaiserbacteria bacterium RIFCSPLOWO2_01_FULL_50_24 TaxID=1798507 RepID=A0A1F6EQY3_9BACT|nr:MAG: hypothetical protein A2673_02360 [Candidatus Kaiserbacteria bacterium RIFCSPHIGHO2_01_FULL_50_13]OGG76031.1 MAG: hypothetical protein A3A34_00055 [Candidatus Kaiserbacteria bacterium RIFCSPLOWO2_01_FULL_50_24]OGG82037.1 MAG: hypothetical protein A3H74_03470 [Candidatus Kaiserbacteria bacterium RIFCSPLOWO2_02_FULL_51_13]